MMEYFSSHISMKRIFPATLGAAVFLTFSAGVFSAHAVRPSYFSDMREARNDNLDPFPKWTTMGSRFSEQSLWSEDECDRRKYYPCRVKEWKSLLDRQRGASLADSLEQVNRYVNRFPYVIDQVNWGVLDYWETPYEIISVSGDCEDYAIAKYYSLRYLGLSADRLRVIIVQDYNLGGIIHAILGVYADNNELLILDNQIKQVVPANKIYHYRPIYGVNEKSWWAYYTQ